ncbi:hypothetical protein CEW88_23815 (plasmid) [Alloyangia pacifica]|uniref:Uncharacterized protein n=1 Tax=Alloyangia pacifica TaxID=311180 RepID=A0A2U8HM38_9RHOB|nr:hypothetical protein [Alloyangia pacifica]AWI86801.1 hypothetical protein CEW88_23815 [Alloyangia pacifica]
MFVGVRIGMSPGATTPGAPGDPVPPLPGGSGTVDLSSGASLAFPEGNLEQDLAGSQLALQTTWSAAADGNNLFFPLSADGVTAFFAHLRLPMELRNTSNRFALVSGFSDSSSDFFTLSYFGAAQGTPGLRNRMVAGVRTQTASSLEITEEDFLIVATTGASATQLRLDWYGPDGSRHAGGLSGSFGPVNISSTDGFFTLGANAGVAADPMPADGYPDNVALGWPGEIRACGFVKSGEPGVPIPEAVWQEIATGDDVAAALSGTVPLFLRVFDGTAASLAAPGPGDMTHASTAWPLVASLRPGGSVGRSALSGWLRPDRHADGFVYGIAAGETSREVTLAGTADAALDGQAVRVRLVYEDGTIAVDWTSLGTISGGAFSGTVSVPYGLDRGWIGATQYDLGDGEIVAEDRDRWGVGWKIMPLGQSQLAVHMLKITHRGRKTSNALVSYAHENPRMVNSPASLLPSLHRLGRGWTLSDGASAFADQLAALGVGCPVMILPDAVDGTGPDSLLDDSSGARNWSELSGRLAAFGHDVSCVVMNWATQGWSTRGSVAETLEALIYGTGSYGGTVDHCLNDELRAGWQFGLSPATRHAQGNHEYARQPQIDYANAAGLSVGLPVSDYAITTLDDVHPDGNKTGNITMGARLALLAAQMMGVATPAKPHFTGAMRAGGTIAVSVSLPNGGSLYSPAPTALTGFQVDEGSGWTGAGFTAAINGNAVLLTRDSGAFPAGTQLRYLANGETRNGLDGTDEDRIVSGMLYETWAGDILGLGVPVLGSVSGGAWVSGWSAVT